MPQLEGDPLSGDVGIAVMLSVPRARRCATPAPADPTGELTRLVYLVPATGYLGSAWHVAVLDTVAGVVDGTRNPVTPVGVGLHLSGLGVDFHARDWRPCDQYPPSRLNPFFPDEEPRP